MTDQLNNDALAYDEPGLYASRMQLDTIRDLLREYDQPMVAIRRLARGEVRITIWGGNRLPVCRKVVHVNGTTSDVQEFADAA